MLKLLSLQNIILVEKAELSFIQGLNILTGETGSGKSAIMHGISLAIGERADSAVIRKGCEKGVIEASFECSHPRLLAQLSEGGIEHEAGHDLIIRREVIPSGKGRVFINHQLVQLTFLRKIGMQLVHIVGQHAGHKLLSTDYHRDLLDIYGELEPLLQQFKGHFQQETELQKKLGRLIAEEGQRLREIAICQRELEELEEARLKEGEEEELFTEYAFLFNAEEISTKIEEINQALTGNRQPIIASLHRQKQLLQDLSAYDPKLQEAYDSLQNALLELTEISHTLQNYQGRLQSQPERLHQVNERLTFLNHLKRKYGPTVQEIVLYQSNAKDKLIRLENAEMEIEDLKLKLEIAAEKSRQIAEELSSKRKIFAEQLQKELTEQLHSLNMNNATFKVSIEPQKRTIDGDDKVEFFICPNLGEHEIPLKDSASGGEISRVLLALQTLLAGKEQKGALIFDEIDGNIGGETASIVGDKLQQIARRHQVICITHFPQVACKAEHHLQIIKQEKEGRTVTLVQALDSPLRKKELERMAGGKKRG